VTSNLFLQNMATLVYFSNKSIYKAHDGIFFCHHNMKICHKKNIDYISIYNDLQASFKFKNILPFWFSILNYCVKHIYLVKTTNVTFVICQKSWSYHGWTQIKVEITRDWK
jgi:hypothetical protein